MMPKPKASQKGYNRAKDDQEKGEQDGLSIHMGFKSAAL